MALNITPGSATASSYFSVNSATEYFNTRINSDLWHDMGSTSTLSKTTYRENVLKQAAREMDRTYRYFSSKYSAGILGDSDYQALQFPRSNMINSAGNLYIPLEVKYSQAEQALWILQRGDRRTNSEGTVINPNLISDDSYNYIRGWIDRSVQAVGNYKWQK